MFAASDPASADGAASPDPGRDRPSASENAEYHHARYSDMRPSPESRLFGMGGTTLMMLLVLGGLLVSWRVAYPPAPSSALIVVNLLPPASPPEAPPEEADAPEPIDKQEKPPEIPGEPRDLPPPLTDSLAPAAPARPAPAEPVREQIEAAAPKTLPAPPAPALSSNATDSWEGQVLAALHRQRRYPRAAMARREQGVPWIRFVMDRDGRVLSSRLERSSGYPDLDREAVTLPRRAQPLPAPPADRSGDTIELVVPVEFFLNAR